MEYLAVGIRIPLFLQHTGGLGKVILHGRLVVELVEHFFTVQFAYQAGKTWLFLRCTDPCPTGDFFIEPNRNVFHVKVIVQHQIRVKANFLTFFRDRGSATGNPAFLFLGDEDMITVTTKGKILDSMY